MIGVEHLMVKVQQLGPITSVTRAIAHSCLVDITSIDSRSLHIDIFGCNKVTFKNINLRAPDESPNTDGIRMAKSQDINILDSTIGTGDDCVALLSGLKNVRIERVRCGPGHGISVGSLGKFPYETDTSGLIVKDCTLVGTDNGLRIKSWESPYKATVHSFTYENIIMKNVQNPIIIDQQYCPSGNCRKGQGSLIAIKDIRFTNITGTSASEIAIKLQCSHTVPCRDIVLKDIDLHSGDNKSPVKSSCATAAVLTYGIQNPKACTYT